jgi:hypothetical protein
MKNSNPEDFECHDRTAGCGCTKLLGLLDSISTIYAYPLPTTIPNLGPLRVDDDAVEGFDY